MPTEKDLKDASGDPKKASPPGGDALAKQYGWSVAVLRSVPELWRLFLRALEGEWEPGKFISQLRETKWFKTHSATYRENWVQKISDPDTWSERIDAKQAEVEDLSVQLTGVSLSRAQARSIAEKSLLFGWNDAQMRNTLSAYLKQVGGGTGHYGGDAGTAEMELRQYASDQGITLSGTTLAKWLKAIVAQKNTVQDYKAWIMSQAESAYGGLAEYIRSGKTVRQLADPYMQEMADILEMNPAGIDLKNPLIADALQWANPDGKSGLMSLGAFRRKLKADPRYMQTKKARDDVLDVGNAVLKDFGLM